MEKKNFKELLRQVRAVILDVDGVLTDGSVTLIPGGDQVRKMDIRDGFAIQYAVKSGIRIGVITGGYSQSVKDRLNSLGVYDVFLGAVTKKEAYDEFILTYGFNAEEILYMGDDIPDLEIMKLIGVPVCPYDSAPEIREVSVYISPKKGGEGCVRDILEQLLRINGKWTF